MKEFIIIPLMIVLGFVIYVAGMEKGRELMKTAAVQHGKAEYLTAENGKQIWRWKP